jgi:anti-anti-sigma factor
LHLAIIITAFVRQPKVRPALGVLFLTILIASLFGLTLNLNPQFARLSNLAQTVPIAAVMAYIIFSTRFVLPTQVALEQALKSIRDLVVVLDDERNIMYANDAAAQLNFRSGSTLAQALHAGSTDQDAINHVLAAGRRVHSTLALGQRRFTLGLTPVLDRKGRVRSELLLGRDVTEVEERTNQLEAERANLAAAVVQLEAEQREREQLEATVQELSLPVIPVLPGVLVLPLVGNVDGARANDFLQVLLGAVERERARLVLLDITGVPLLDTGGAAVLMQGVQGAALLGARCVLVGVRPEIAQALVSLGVALDHVPTAATLQQAVQREISRGMSGKEAKPAPAAASR